MEREQIVETLGTKITLYKHLGLRAMRISSHEAVFHADLSQNLNHKQTAFGGSLYAGAVTAAYSLVLALLQQHQVTTEDIVIAQASIRYLRPIAEDYEVRAIFVKAMDVASEKKWVRHLTDEGKNKIAVKTLICVDGKKAVEFIGKFVVNALARNE